MRQRPGPDTMISEVVTDGLSPSVLAALDREVRALFREARRRRRRRWLAGLAVVFVAAILVAAAVLTWLGRGPREEVGGARRSEALTVDRSSATAVWVDDSSRVHLGAIGADGRLSQRVVGEANAAAEPLVAVGRRVYWVDPAGKFVPSLGHWSQVVRTLNLRTRQVSLAGAGQTVFLSADRHYLLMSQMPTSLTETPVAGGRPRSLSLPRGWYLPGGNGLADPLEGQGLDTVNGIVVQSKESPGVSVRRIALWDPRTRTVQVIGRAQAVIDAYTPPGAHYSLLAWLPAGCAAPQATEMVGGPGRRLRSSHPCCGGSTDLVGTRPTRGGGRRPQERSLDSRSVVRD
ncbi:MAG: hypothetical protein LBV34_26795, partial [Nocardiopsaceae bacterium]|nr:hypothetical protein [Nocardiopsaceae bacterium]